MIPHEVVMARTARAYGMAPWALEHALETDPAALRWWLMAPMLADFEDTLARADKEG